MEPGRALRITSPIARPLAGAVVTVAVLSVLSGCGGSTLNWSAAVSWSAGDTAVMFRNIYYPVCNAFTPEAAQSAADVRAQAWLREAEAHAATYSGTSHPLVIINSGFGPQRGLTAESAASPSDNWDGAWEGAATTGQQHGSPPQGLLPRSRNAVQLVACVTADDMSDGSCGEYTDYAGVVGEIQRMKSDVTVRIVVARTGSVIGQKTFKGRSYHCPLRVSSEYDPAIRTDPPWVGHGWAPDLSAPGVEPYIVGFTTGLLQGPVP